MLTCLWLHADVCMCALTYCLWQCVWEWGLGVRCSTLTKLNSVYHSCLWSCFCGDISHLTLIHSASEFSVLGSLWSWSTPPSASTPPFEFQNILRQQCENKLTPPSSVPSIVFDSGNCVAIGHTPNIPFMMLAMFIALSPWVIIRVILVLLHLFIYSQSSYCKFFSYRGN